MSHASRRRGGGWRLLACLPWLLAGGAAADEPEAYRAPRAGENHETRVLGRDVLVPARDRRSLQALDLGLSVTAPGPAGSEVLPFGALFVFQRPDDDRQLDAVVSILQNEILYARSPFGWGPFELLLALDTFTVPVPQAEIVDGDVRDELELLWGSVHAGFGLGARTRVGPAVDNLFSVALLVEPGFLYFDDGSDTAADFVDPSDTFELRVRLRLRYDRFERNLLEMIHSGVGLGLDAVFGSRDVWRDWGRGGAQDGDAGREYGLLYGYVQGAAGAPFVASERHRLVGSAHFGVGTDVDRFSAQRLGGGPEGDQFRALRRPLVPGAVIGEFFPENYVVVLLEYRYEVFFFSFVGLRGSLARLDRDRLGPSGIARRDDWLASLGARLTTGFVLESRLQLDYNYNFDVIRDGALGGHEVVLEVSRSF